jgi:preprotein translocase subunit SecA
LKTAPHDLSKVLRDIVESVLLKNVLSRLAMTIERRLNSRLAVNVDGLAELDWVSIEDRILEAVDLSFRERIDQLEQPDSQIRQNIASLIRKQKESAQIPDAYEMAAAISMGTQMVIDARTRQRVNRRVNLLNYIYLAALQIENEDPQDISAVILAHLEDIQSKMQIVWGKMELQRMAENNAKFSDLPEEYRTGLAPFMDKEAERVLQTKELPELLNENNAPAIRVFGKATQQNIYRYILLHAISDLWIEQLTRMEALRISIGMEAYAQLDPLVQYKSRSTDAFKNLFADIRMGVINRMFRLQPARPQTAGVEGQTTAKAEAGQPAKPGGNQDKGKKKRHKKR